MNKYLLLISLMLASTNALAAISKWVDSNGQMHYSDTPPPPNVKKKSLRSSSEAEDSAASGVAAPKTLAEREAELKKNQKEKKEATDKAAKERANQETTKEACSTAKQNLMALQQGMRIVEIDEKGERSFIDDNQRAKRTEKAQKDISNYCK